MRILHVTEYCHAGSIGGTERYLLDLIRELEAAGFENTISWLQPGIATETLEIDGIRTLKLPSPPMRVDAPLAEFMEAAASLLDSEKPDWVHFHTFGLTEAALAKLAKLRGIPYAFTYHSPAWTCRRETMLLYGKKPCDGEVRAWRCSACQSEERLGLGKLAGHAATAASMLGGWATLPLGTSSLRRRSAFFHDTQRYRRVLRNFLAECDLVVSCCDWSGPVLLRNGARENSLIHCPQGVPNAIADALCENSELRTHFVVGYVGRVDEVKGVHILMEGFSKIKADDARLRIVGWDTDHPDLPYARRLQQLAETDSRIELVPKRSFAETLAEYRKLSLLAIPSVWMETGPLTLLEALALGIPVYGSNRLGQLQLLREHGRVVEPNTPAGWQVALTEALAQWKIAPGRWKMEDGKNAAFGLRTMNDVARETARCYQKLSNCCPKTKSDSGFNNSALISVV